MEMGSQSARRITQILEVIAAQSKDGIRLLELASNLPIERTTIYRIVPSLVASNLVLQQPNRRYILGRGLFEIGPSAGQHFNIASRMTSDRHRDIVSRIKKTVRELGPLLNAGTSALSVWDEAHGNKNA